MTFARVAVWLALLLLGVAPALRFAGESATPGASPEIGRAMSMKHGGTARGVSRSAPQATLGVPFVPTLVPTDIIVMDEPALSLPVFPRTVFVPPRV